MNSLEVIEVIIGPFVIGFLLGVYVTARGRLVLVLSVLAAPGVALITVCASMVAVGMATGKAPVNPDNPHPLLVQWLVTAGLYAPHIFACGALPSVMGVIVGHLIAVFARRRSQRT